MDGRLSPVVVAILLVGVCATPAGADPVRCQREVAKATSKLVQAKVKTLQKCEDSVLRGRTVGPCPDAKASMKITRAAEKLAAAVAKRCGGSDRVCGTGDDDPLASIGWDLGACPNFESGACGNAIADCADVGTCLGCVVETAVDQAIDLAYPAAASPDATTLKCQREIGKNVDRFLRAKTKHLQKCADDVLKGKSAGPCPDAKASVKIAKAESNLRTKICKTCGGGNRACGGGDDLSPAAIGFAASCPDVSVPGGPACGGAITSLTEMVDCIACVSEYKADCLAAVAAPTLGAYPAECNGGTSGTPTPTATPTAGGPTTTPTPGPNCGNDTVDPGEDCDGTDDAGCPGECSPVCTCPAGCDLPNPVPEIVTFTALAGSELDTGWTGVSHDTSTVDDAALTAGRLSNCDLSSGSSTCGQCDYDGPIAFPGTADTCACFSIGNPDSSSLTSCDPEAPTCGGGETCTCFLGPPLPISAGAVPVCVVNRHTGPATGTVNLATGTGAVEISLASVVHNGLAVERPCPTCEGDPTPRDGVKGGTCNGGVQAGLPCDTGGTHDLFGPLSIDCHPTQAAVIGTLAITFDPATTGTTSLATGPACTATGFGSSACFCDTCATAAAEPCNTNADCPGGVACGGRRCIGGANSGTPCGVNSECPGGFCNRPGVPTAPNQCADGVCSPNPGDGFNEGLCEAGPIDSLCNLETFRGCTNDTDCNPPPSGNCGTCAAGQVCTPKLRECFQDPIVRAGVPGTQQAVVVTTFCIPPTSSQSVNQVAGLPGPGALALPTRIFQIGAQCGNGAVDGGEDCDPPADGACPGACQVDCTCPTCGDGIVNQPGEQCDGGDDAACPGDCQPDCTCTAGVCGNNATEFGEQCDGSDDAACPGACQPDCSCGAVCGNDVVEAGEQCDGTGSLACPPAACQPDCTCGPFCGDGTVDPGEECDGTGVGFCPGTCEGDCTCSPVCGDNVAEGGELCDGTDDTLCPGVCTSVCTCPSQGELSFVVRPGADLDTGWTGTAHDFVVQAGSTITGEISGCDGIGDQECAFFGNVGSFCSADPSRACTNTNQCSGAGSCIINTFGPPLPLSAGGVPACIINRFATDVTGTYNLQTGDTELFVNLNSLVHLGNAVSRPCPVCDCGKPNIQDCQIGETGTCSDILGGPPCRVQGTGYFGPTSNDCPPSSSLNVSGGGLDILFDPVTTGTVSVPSSLPCAGNQSCWCPGQPRPSQCLNACDGGANDGQACDSDANCPGAPAGACKPLCRQIVGEAVGEGECVAGPISQTCGGAPEIGCQTNSDCPAGKGPCVASNQRCFMDPIVRVGTPGTVTNEGAAVFCIPATSGQAINQTAGLPGPGAIVFPNDVDARRCGDGVVNRVREECDGADDANCPGACFPNCTCNVTCGNDVVEFGEQCDGTSDAACPGQCVAPGQAGECTCPPVCGDGFVGPDEQCDPGGPGGSPPPSDAQCPGLCLSGSCQCPLPGLPQCGNNVLDAGEVCDLPAIGCGPLQVCLACTQCFPPPDVVPPEAGFICGNGNVEPTEVCDLPAIGCGDGEICGPDCTECIAIPISPVCGNLNIETGEVCELPSIGCGEGETCLLCQECIETLPICGNLNLEPGEACELPARGCGPLQVCLACVQCVP